MLFHIVVDHRRSQHTVFFFSFLRLSIWISQKERQGVVDVGDDLVHIQIQRWQLLPARETNFGKLFAQSFNSWE